MDDATQPTVRELMDLRRKELLEQLAAVDREIAAYDRYQADLAARYQPGLPFKNSAPALLSPSTLVRMPIVAYANSTAGMSISDLIKVYQTYEESPYKKLKHNSKQLYDSLIKLIEADYGQKRLADITANMLDEWHGVWVKGGKVAIAHSKIAMVRNLFGFGVSVLNDPECGRLFGILAKRKYAPPKARNEFLSHEQANLIRVKAHELQRPSIALAQAFQSGVGMLQKDVIGEYVPVSEPGASDVILDGSLKWLRGIRWEEIDENLRLRHSGYEEIDVDLKDVPMVLDEFELQFKFLPQRHPRAKLPTKGAIILSEYGEKLPWTPVEYRRWWRRVADACGIPKTVRSMDSRKTRKVRAGGK
jgi:hypothetical protein